MIKYKTHIKYKNYLLLLMLLLMPMGHLSGRESGKIIIEGDIRGGCEGFDEWHEDFIECSNSFRRLRRRSIEYRLKIDDWNRYL